MNILTKEQFINKKTSDILAVFGTGYSINNLTDPNWNKIESEYDTIGFGWYCKSKRPTTWYVIREQANKPLRQFKNHDLNDLFELMKHYNSSCKIIKDMPYRRFKKTLYKKVRGKWKKKKTFSTANEARTAMKRLREKEEKKLRASLK